MTTRLYRAHTYLCTSNLYTQYQHMVPMFLCEGTPLPYASGQWEVQKFMFPVFRSKPSMYAVGDLPFTSALLPSEVLVVFPL